jgi:hypothetical protein
VMALLSYMTCMSFNVNVSALRLELNDSRCGSRNVLKGINLYSETVRAPNEESPSIALQVG